MANDHERIVGALDRLQGGAMRSSKPAAGSCSGRSGIKPLRALGVQLGSPSAKGHNGIVRAGYNGGYCPHVKVDGRAGQPRAAALHPSHDSHGSPVALVGHPAIDERFAVELRVPRDSDDESLQSVVRDVLHEIDFHLDEVGGPNPWEHANLPLRDHLKPTPARPLELLQVVRLIAAQNPCPEHDS